MVINRPGDDLNDRLGEGSDDLVTGQDIRVGILCRGVGIDSTVAAALIHDLIGQILRGRVFVVRHNA